MKRHKEKIIVPTNGFTKMFQRTKIKLNNNFIKTFEIGFIEFGITKDVWGFCLFDKYSYTTYFGWEILK